MEFAADQNLAVRLQDERPDVVHLRQDSDLLFDAPRIPERVKPIRQRVGSAGTSDAVVAGEAQAVMEKIVDVIAEALDLTGADKADLVAGLGQRTYAMAGQDGPCAKAVFALPSHIRFC